jgi:hypothetical protein
MLKKQLQYPVISKTAEGVNITGVARKKRLSCWGSVAFTVTGAWEESLRQMNSGSKSSGAFLFLLGGIWG